MKQMLRNKKGIEPVIATVLLIVITIAVVGVVVAFVVPYIQGIMDKQTACNGVALRIDETGTCTNSSTAYTQVMVEVTLNEFNLSKITTYVLSGGNTMPNVSVGSRLPENGGARTYTVVFGNATKVWAIPAVNYKSKEFTCDNSRIELTPVPVCA
ncbi:MAG: hypothetical protein NTX24_02025 [Candidatus Pacearchaeota archaeon]|nr:hypothetical protein [Candidatus Pacearchaeota archaeon]